MLDVSTFWGAFWTNVIAGALITLILWTGNELRYIFHLYLKFNNKEFDIFYKGVSEPCRTAKCKVCRNKILYNGKQIVAGSMQGDFEGAFIMNPLNLKMGDGYHYHKNFAGFNFPRVIIKDSKTFFVETDFIKKAGIDNTDKDFENHSQAYIWVLKNKKSK